MNDSTAFRLRIESGQATLRWLARGSRITAMDGTVRVEGPPQWLAETVQRDVSIIGPGAPFELRHAGWVALHSDGTADVLVEPAAVRPNAVVTALRALVRCWRRRIGAASSPSHAA